MAFRRSKIRTGGSLGYWEGAVGYEEGELPLPPVSMVLAGYMMRPGRLRGHNVVCLGEAVQLVGCVDSV